MTRGLVAGVTTAIAGDHVDWFPLLDLALDSGTVYLAGLAEDVLYSGHTYQAALGLGTIEPVEETDGEVKGLAFTMAAAPGSNIALALGTDVAGRAVTLRFAFLDSGGALQVDPNVWTGYLDQMTVEDDPETGRPVIRVTAEHKLQRWDVPKVRRFSDEDQRALLATDGFFKHTAAVAEAVIVWPSKEFFK